MAGTISFGGIGSGLDTEGIVSGLVQASSGSLNALKARAAQTKSAVTTLSDVSSMLSKLKTAVTGLKEPRDVAGYSVTSSKTAVVASANGLALPGSFEVTVEKLARAHRSYSDPQPLASTPLGQEGTIKFKIGETEKSITLEAGDTLEDVSTKINSLGMRLNASIFNTGSERRLQIRGLDTGAENALTMTEQGTTLGLARGSNQIQAASDARVLIDGHAVTRPNNQIQGAIQGVTLALKEESTDPITIDVASDPTQLTTKLQSVVDAYNSVIKKLHDVAGFGSQKASNSVLAGDPTMRGINNRLSSAILTPIEDAGTYNSPGSIGINFNNDGTLKLDTAKLTAALERDPASVTKVIAGSGDKPGVMDILSDLVGTLAERGRGAVTVRKDSLESRAKALDDQVTREQERLAKYGDALRKQFTAMDIQVSGANSLLAYIGRI